MGFCIWMLTLANLSIYPSALRCIKSGNASVRCWYVNGSSKRQNINCSFFLPLHSIIIKHSSNYSSQKRWTFKETYFIQWNKQPTKNWIWWIEEAICVVQFSLTIANKSTPSTKKKIKRTTENEYGLKSIDQQTRISCAKRNTTTDK